MEALKEYAGVITSAVTVVAALGALGLWAINVQVTPEFHRLEGRIEQLDGKIDANLKVINDRFNLKVDERFKHIGRAVRAHRRAVRARRRAVQPPGDRHEQQV